MGLGAFVPLPLSNKKQFTYEIKKEFDSMTFTTWLKKSEGFASKSQYDNLLNNLQYEAQRKVSIYYKEKYKYFLDTQPKQLEFK